LIGNIAPSTVRRALGVVVQIPTLPSVSMVNAFKGFHKVPIQISKILVDNHILYAPKTVELSVFAIVLSHIAIEFFALAIVELPIAVETSQFARVIYPIAVEYDQLACVPLPIAVERNQFARVLFPIAKE
jgi:hypothetical protein